MLNKLFQQINMTIVRLVFSECSKRGCRTRTTQPRRSAAQAEGCGHMGAHESRTSRNVGTNRTKVLCKIQPFWKIQKHATSIQGPIPPFHKIKEKQCWGEIDSMAPCILQETFCSTIWQHESPATRSLGLHMSRPTKSPGRSCPTPSNRDKMNWEREISLSLCPSGEGSSFQ